MEIEAEIELDFGTAASCLELHDLTRAGRLLQQGLRKLAVVPADRHLLRAGWELLALHSLFVGDAVSCELWLKQCMKSPGSHRHESERALLNQQLAEGNVSAITACLATAQGEVKDAVRQFLNAAAYHDAAHDYVSAARDRLLASRVLRFDGDHQRSRALLCDAEQRLQSHSDADNSTLLQTLRTDRRCIDRVRAVIEAAVWN